MEENKNITAGYEDEDVILPDGWADGDDIFSEDAWTGDANADEQEADEEIVSEEVTPEEGEESPTPEMNTEVLGDSTPAEEAAAPTPEQQEPAGNRLKFRARVDREDLDVELDESELPTLYQKAQVTDRVQAKLAKMAPILEKAEKLRVSLGYETLDEMFSSAESNYRDSEVKRLVGEGVHEEVAKDMVARRMGGTRTQESPVSDTTPAENDPAVEKARDFRSEVNALVSAYPELQGKQLPDSVVQDCVRNNKSLVVAYAEYRVGLEKAEAEKLRKENNILKQNAASAARAPVTGSSGGGATDTKPKDPFLEGFDEDY